jgi:hypothetical protein
MLGKILLRIEVEMYISGNDCFIHFKAKNVFFPGIFKSFVLIHVQLQPQEIKTVEMRDLYNEYKFVVFSPLFSATLCPS